MRASGTPSDMGFAALGFLSAKLMPFCLSRVDGLSSVEAVRSCVSMKLVVVSVALPSKLSAPECVNELSGYAVVIAGSVNSLHT